MSNENTPAIERAAEANYLTRAGFRDDAREMYRASGPEILQSWADATRPVLAAALDRDEIARAIYDQSVINGDVAADCFGIDWDTTDAFYSEADAVIAMVLGTAS